MESREWQGLLQAKQEEKDELKHLLSPSQDHFKAQSW